MVPRVARAPLPSCATPAFRSTRLDSYESPTPPAGGCGCATVGPCFVFTVRTREWAAEALASKQAAAATDAVRARRIADSLTDVRTGLAAERRLHPGAGTVTITGRVGDFTNPS